MLWHVIQPAPRSATSRYILELASLAAQQIIVVYSSTSDGDRHGLPPDVVIADVLKGLAEVSQNVWLITDNLVALSFSEDEGPSYIPPVSNSSWGGMLNTCFMKNHEFTRGEQSSTGWIRRCDSKNSCEMFDV